MRFQAVNRCLMASVWWASDFRLSTLRALGLILVAPPMADGASARRGRWALRFLSHATPHHHGADGVQP